MLLLAFFAFVVGAATAVSPCVLPVLPALLAAGASGGRRRPLRVVIGLAAAFTLAIVGLAEVLHGVGLGNSGARDFAIAILLVAGLVLLLPALGARLEAPLSPLARRGAPSTGDGFWSGLGVGAALGFVYAPCAGPVLAAVIAVSAASGRTLLVGASYAAGSAVVLLVLARGGGGRLAGFGGAPAAGIQRVAGAVMVVTAAAMAFQLDVRFEEQIARHLPDALVNPANALEKSGAVQKRLADLRGRPRFEEEAHAATAPHGRLAPLKDYGEAPGVVGTQKWFNTPGGRPLTLRSLRGRVVLIDFWTYTCINCIRTLPYLRAWDARYRNAGLTVVGVHTPEFPFERETGNVKNAISADRIRYPVVQDNNYGTWTAYGNQYWPAEYLIDARGRVRYTHFGEGDYDKDERAIRTLLAERGDSRLAGVLARVPAIPPSRVVTPETYVGTERALGWTNGPQKGRHDYGRPP